ncbi:MAG TPA: GntR family transcriptional regulator [Thermomicrobiaceae bacterium]|nr:GntR family transcriptional regulator [Thermomicrobiaceae bacterium]
MADISSGSVIEVIQPVLDPSSRTPLYQQLASALGQAIRSGTIPAGTMLPPEPELAASLGVSRQTVNQALVGLARRGLVTRRRGVGTIVAEPDVEQPLGGLYTFIRSLASQGRSPSSRMLGYRVTLDDEASPLLTGRADGLIVEFSRLRLVDEQPFIVESIYLPIGLGERLPVERVGQEQLYDLLRELCDIDITSADETLRPVTLERSDAALLGLQAGEPAFLVERTGYAAGHSDPVELRRSLIRGDRYRFRVHLEGEAL